MENLNNILASLHYLNHPILSGISALSCFFIGIFVLAKGYKSNLYRTFFLMSFSLGIWFLGNTLSMLYYNNFKYAFFWFKFGYTAVPLMAVSFYHFYLTQVKKKSKIIFFLYLIGAAEIIYLWFVGDIGAGDYILPNVGVIFKGTASNFFYLGFFGMAKYVILTTITAVFFFRSYKIEEDILKKSQFKLLSILFFVIILGGLEWLVIFNIPLHIAWAIIPFFVSFIAYTILKYQLFDIKILAKKALFYSIGIALANGVIIMIIFINDRFKDRFPFFQSWAVPLIAAVATFIIANILYRQLKVADKLKYEFITVAAHKLRTPLTDIKWAAASLKDAKISDGDKDKMIKEIIAADERLINLTNELLVITKTEANQYQYNFEIVDLEKTVRKIVNSFQMQIKEKKIKFKYNAEKNLPKVKIDKIRIGSVTQTLMENAVLYTKDEIIINIDVYKNSVVFHIEDNGIGISKEDQPHIFSRFYRTSKAYLTETEGAGIGLFLAKSIIDKHGGKIGARSEGEGKGSIFWFSLKAVE
jgi:signal transduction histidine kinase